MRLRRFKPARTAALGGLLLAGGLLVFPAGCSRAPDGEGTPVPVSDHIGKARAFYQQGDYPRAVEMYHKALELEPDNADVYLQLGLIYDDNLKEKNLAAVYYREFLIRNPDSERAGRVRQWLEKCLAAAPGESAPPPEGEISPGRIVPEPSRPAPPPPARPRPTAVPAVPAAPAGRPDTYTVRGGDTLAGIARELYGDPNAWNRIYQANRDQLGNPHALKVGQTLAIPR